MAVPTLCNGNGSVYYASTLLLCLHYVMVTVQGITQCVHSIAVHTLCNGNGSRYYTMYNVSTLLRCLHYVMVTVQGITQCIMYPLYCCAYTM